jgi:cyanophycin synthetase
MKFLRVTHLRGPNIWTYRPIIEAWVDIGAFEEAPSNALPGFTERLTAWLPGLIEHRCGVGERGGFIERLRDGTWIGHVLEHVAIELQNQAGMPTGFGQTRSTPEKGIYKVVFRARDEHVGRAALAAARELVLAAVEDRPFDLAATLTELRDLVDDRYLGPSTASIVDAAAARKIPAIRLNEGNLVQLGYGARQRRIWTAETDQTSAIAEGISRDKDLTKRLLQSCGVPVPEGEIVHSAAEAWEAAEDIGLPVVIKPVDGNHGRGVSLDLNTREDIEAAYALAEPEGSDVIVERCIHGDEHRLLVVGGRMIAAAGGEAASIVGDGKNTIRTLIDLQLNTDPRRGLTEDFPLNRILVDEDPAIVLDLARRGLSPESIPEAGQDVLIQRNGNVAVDVTDKVHPDVAAAVSLAARVVGLDIAGVDLVTEDISRPLAETKGAIVEVNAGPGLLMHIKPFDGPGQPVGQAIVDHLFPADEDGRIPVVGITGSQHTTAIARLVAWLLRLNGNFVGLACRDGLFLARRQVEKADRANGDAAQRVLMNRQVDAAVFENSAESILSEGLAYDRCQVGVVTGLELPPELSAYYVRDDEQMFKVLRTQIDIVLPSGAAVLNAQDERVVAMAPLCDGEVVFYSLDPDAAPLQAHLQSGGRAVCLRGENIVLATGEEELVLTDLATVEKVRIGQAPVAPAAMLAAIATAWALGVSEDLVRAGVETFETASSTSGTH